MKSLPLLRLWNELREPLKTPAAYVDPVVEEMSPSHQADLAGQAEVGREQRALRGGQPHGPDCELIVGQRRHEAAETHLEPIVEVKIEEGVEQVGAVLPPIEGEDVFDRPGDLAVEEEALAGEEEAADRGSLAGVGPGAALDLLEDVDLEPELLVVRLEMEAGAEVQLQRALRRVVDVRETVMGIGEGRLSLETPVLGHRRSEIDLLTIVHRRRRRADGAALPRFALGFIAQPLRQLRVSLHEQPHLLVMLPRAPF
jgi:hypothetical protein